MRNCFVLAGFTAALLAGRADASGFFDANQDAVRADLEYLINSRVLNVPVTTWPMPIDEIHDAVAEVSDAGLGASEVAALNRLKAKLDVFDTPDDDAVTLAVANRPPLFRQNEPLPREKGMATLEGGRDYGRFTVHLAGTAASREQESDSGIPVDRQRIRLDGTYVSAHWGNWIWSAGELARSWGPSQHDAIELSNNARPIPSFGVDRLSSHAPNSRWLSWIGPWRFSLFLGKEETNRDDVRGPLFGGARITFKPFKKVEIGLSRTSQFCGQGRQCGFNTFKNLLFGNTNTNTSANLTKATDPGNDEAGFDIRLTSPIGHLPYAITAQMIGEDQQGGIPFKYLGQFGFNTWKSFDNGSAFFLDLQYSNTTCSFTSSDPNVGCAYHHYIFDKEGYRYKGKVIGSTWQGDAEVMAAYLKWITASGTEIRLNLRHGQLNRFDYPDPYNVVAPRKRNLDGVDLEIKYASQYWGEFRAGAGMDRIKNTSPTSLADGDTAYGKSTNAPRLFLIWRHRI